MKRGEKVRRVAVEKCNTWLKIKLSGYKESPSELIL